MPVDDSLVGRRFAPTVPYPITAERVAAFHRATLGGAEAPGSPVPSVPVTFPIVLAFEAMGTFLTDVGLDLSRIVHGDQSFRYARPLVVGDVLQARLQVTSVRSLGGADLIGTTSEITDAAGEAVCWTKATLVHNRAETGAGVA